MKELTVDAKPVSLREIKDFISAMLEMADCPQATRNQIYIVVDEVFANIANYAFENEEGSVTVRFEIESEPQAVVLTFLDDGVPFDPLEAEEPDISLKAKERKIGGLGILMMRRLMDEVSYEYSDGKNVLTLRKTF